MLRFENSDYLYGLLLIPALLLLFILMLQWKKAALDKFGEKHVIHRLFPDASRNRQWVKFGLMALGMVFLIVAIANPQIGTKTEQVNREGVDVIIALDISNSMRAEDIKPNRLERSKRAIARLIDRMPNERIGIIVFAGHAYVQLPLTSDYAAAKLFLSSINTGLIPTQGTAIGAAIDLASRSYDKNDTKHKALIIITDGENHEDNAEKMAKKAAEEGLIIHTIGMGSPSGAPIPVYRGNTQVDHLKDNGGNTVITKLDEDMLQDIARNGNGVFVRASNSDDDIESILQEIGQMEKKNYGAKIFTNYEDRFQYLLAVALLLMIAEIFVSERKSKWAVKLFGGKK